MNIRLSKVSFFLFVFFYNYIWIRMFIFPFMYDNYQNMGFWYILIIMLICLLLFLIPKGKYNYNESYFKYIYNTILIVESILGIVLTTYFLEGFVNELNFISVIIGICLVIIVISNMKTSSIIDMSTLFFIVCLLLIIFSFIYFIPLDVSFLFPIKAFDIGVVLVGIFLVLDNLSFMLIDRNDFKVTGSNLFVPIVCSILLFGFEYFMVLGSSGDVLFKGIDNLGFVVMLIKPVAKYVGNFDFVYIVCLLLIIVFKLGFNMSIVKNSFDNNIIKKCVNYMLILGCLLIEFFIGRESFGGVIYWINMLKFILVIWVIKNVWKIKR